MLNNVATSRQRGASLMEAILWMALAAVIAIALFALFRGGWSSTKVRTETSYLQQIAATVNEMYATNRDFGSGTDLTPILASTKAAPAPMIVGNQLRNSWNGQTTVTGNNDVFTITTTLVPSKECIELAQISINATAVAINGSTVAVPVTPAAASSSCASGDNTIAWRIR